MPRSPLINYFDSRILGTSTFIRGLNFHRSLSRRRITFSSIKNLKKFAQFYREYSLDSIRRISQGLHELAREYTCLVQCDRPTRTALSFTDLFPWKFGKIKTHCLSQRGIAATGHRSFSASSPTSWIYRPPPVSSLSPLPVHHAARSCHDPRTLAGTRKGKGTMKRWKEGREEGGGGRTARRETSEQRVD